MHIRGLKTREGHPFEQDTWWGEQIPDGHTTRATFQQPLSLHVHISPITLYTDFMMILRIFTRTSSTLSALYPTFQRFEYVTQHFDATIAMVPQK